MLYRVRSAARRAADVITNVCGAPCLLEAGESILLSPACEL